VKALSVSSGYAMLIWDGTKTIECRTWQTKHRGELLICSNKDKVPGAIPGRALCIVELVNVRPFTKKDLDAAFLPKEAFDKNSFAWELKYKCTVMPIEVRGKPGLFDVPDEQIQRIDESSMTDAEQDELFNRVFMPLTIGAEHQD